MRDDRYGRGPAGPRHPQSDRGRRLGVRPYARHRPYGRRNPRTGTEPTTARSALGLRALLAAIYTPLFLAGAVLFAVWAYRSHEGSSPSPEALAALAIICAVMALLALADLTVVQRRRHREEDPRRR